MLSLTSLPWGTHLPCAEGLALQVLKGLFFSHPAWRLGLLLVSTHLHYLLIKNNSEKPNLQTGVHGDFKSWLITMLQPICPLILYHWHEGFWDCRIYEHHQNGASFPWTKPKGQQRAHRYLSLLGQESVRFQTTAALALSRTLRLLTCWILPLLYHSLKSLLQLWTMIPIKGDVGSEPLWIQLMPEAWFCFTGLSHIPLGCLLGVYFVSFELG